MKREEISKAFINYQSRRLVYISQKVAFFILIIFLLSAFSSCKSSKKSGNNSSIKPEKLSRKKRRKLNDQIIITCRNFTGTPYKWGGTTRAGMDCSGLLYTSYKLNKVSIPRSSADQSKFGKKVGISNLRKGDWVFFATGRKRRKITHVGLITEVKGRRNVKFIHASTSLGVTESQLFSNYWRKKIVKAVRPLR